MEKQKSGRHGNISMLYRLMPKSTVVVGQHPSDASRSTLGAGDIFVVRPASISRRRCCRRWARKYADESLLTGESTRSTSRKYGRFRQSQYRQRSSGQGDQVSAGDASQQIISGRTRDNNGLTWKGRLICKVHRLRHICVPSHSLPFVPVRLYGLDEAMMRAIGFSPVPCALGFGNRSAITAAVGSASLSLSLSDRRS